MYVIKNQDVFRVLSALVQRKFLRSQGDLNHGSIRVRTRCQYCFAGLLANLSNLKFIKHQISRLFTNVCLLL